MANETTIIRRQPSWPTAAVQQISEYLIEMQQIELEENSHGDPLDSDDREAAWNEVYEEFLTKLQINV
tara:strand:+ start:94 stop:297 length:204 start_codon:yes stop_codon:yes gene_type:complete